MADATQGKSPVEDFYNGSSQSRVVLAKPRLGGFGSSSFASSSNKGSNPFGSILRPSQLKPGTNPFLKISEPAKEEDTEDKDKDKTETNEERLKEQESKQEPDVPKFVPLGSANVTPRTASTIPAPAQHASSSSGFVFGQNLSERVVISESVNNGEASSTDHSSSNGTSELLFTSAAASVKENQEENNSAEGTSSGNSEGLAAAAAEYERSHARPPPPTTNFTITGEEEETNVLQISCRLFAWEAGSWRERGRGALRLNDGAGCAGGARLVARVAGSLRVVLNTPLWRDMLVERAGTKSLRITAADAQHQIKLFLIMGAPGDIAQLHRALLPRIAMSKRSAFASTTTQNATSQEAAERLEAAADDLCAERDRKPADASDAPDASDAQRLAADELKTEPQTRAPDASDATDADKALKRKEPADDETSPKRQCTELIE